MGIARFGPAALATAFGLLLGLALDRGAPPPAADVGRGSEEAYATDLHRREIPPGQGPLRWTRDRAVFRFRDLPLVPAVVQVDVEGHQAPVAIAADGVILGFLGPGATSAAFRLPPARVHAIELHPETFLAADGRRLGTRLKRVAVHPEGRSAPSLTLLLGFALPGVALAFAAGLARLPPWGAVLVAWVASLLQAVALWPSGVLRSPYAPHLAGVLVAGAGLALAFAWLSERLRTGSSPWAFVSVLAAYLVQGVLGTSPVMVVSDAVFHANKLAAVAGGDFFPTSVTQHARPFRFPYGVSFYVLLAPLYRAGIDAVLLVRVGAAVAGVLASCGLFWLLARRDAFAAGLAVVALQLLPATFDFAYSYGNFSNAFGQALTVLFFAWWAGCGRHWPLGAALLALGALAHFSSLVVLVALCAALALSRPLSLRTNRPRALALVVGLGVVALYYGQFLGLTLDQIPRLLEGGGQGRAYSPGVWGAARRQLDGVCTEWGVPALALAWVGRPRFDGGELDRDLAAFWCAGLLLAVPAIFSPLEVRYLYALTAPVAAAAGAGFAGLWVRGRAFRGVACALLLAQAVLCGRALLEAILHRYRV